MLHVIFCLITLGIFFPGLLFGQENSFDNIKEERIRAQDLPNAVESIIPSKLSNNAALPRLPKFSVLKEAQRRVLPNIVEILALQKPIGSLQRHGMLVRGHGVWIQTEKGPQLVSAGHWLKDATHIFVDTQAPKTNKNVLHAQKESFSKRKYDRNPMERIQKDPERFKKLELLFIDKGRNVAILGGKIARPQGLELFDIERELATRIYGMSPLLGNAFIEALIFPPGEKELYIGYYLQTNFLGTLGAPLVSSDGKIIAMTAYPHPANGKRSLVIPPLALRIALERYFSKVKKERGETEATQKTQSSVEK